MPHRTAWFPASDIGAVCWSAPLINEIAHPPSNLHRVAKAALKHKKTFGPTAGWNAVTHAVGFPPTWLRRSGGSAGRLASTERSAGVIGVTTAVLVLSGLGAMLVVAVRRRRAVVAAACAQALLLVGAVLIDAAATPTTDLGLFVTVGYTLLLTAPVSMFVYLVLGWSALTLSDWRSRVPRRVRAMALHPRPAAVGLLIALVGAGMVARGWRGDPGSFDFDREYRDAGAAQSAILAAAPRAGNTRVEKGGGVAGFLERLDIQAYMGYVLRAHGRPFSIPDEKVVFGGRYGGPARPTDTVISADNANEPLPPRARIIARIRAEDQGNGGLVLAATPPSPAPLTRSP